MNYYVYILANATNTTIYTGVTNDLYRRLEEHRSHVDSESFTARYDVTKLVYYEQTSDVKAALAREKQIKGWRMESEAEKQVGGIDESAMGRSASGAPGR